MNVPIGDDRYFMQGVDNLLLSEIPVYSDDEYELRWPLIQLSYPQLFSINMLGEMDTFLTSMPQQFEVEIEEAIDLACFYYCDWDSVVAITDEFLNEAIIEEARVGLIRNLGCAVTAETALQDSMAMLTTALQTFLNSIIGVLSRTGAPAIQDYGCIYRLDHIDDFGNVYFRMMNPSQIFYYLESEDCQSGKFR
ncbi:hypothetical protein [Ralstonia phage RP31]|uniref:Uncharacterized protein n=2 Tax=Ripduovirus RP12 TaxID=2560700 RepID=A0A1L7N0X9_9CAUD|nr:hypothetical protein FDH28_gp263 [Ralstonia phage RP12]BAW19132.1 hypothetical protein [Ralstonia phage RP12]BAW19418.1 hypothetical protein [Ralstonia phage RP31]